ncbi:MAG: serine/threonine-protein kinase [Kofleriaceae bacterium]
MSTDRDALTATVAATPSEATLGETAGDLPPPLDRTTLGRYRLERVLGVGGMGVVHAGFDLDLERKVAIKVLHGEPAHGSRARLLREARAMARLDHPNVVKIYEVDSIEGIDFVVMELVGGGSLGEWLRGAPRPTAEIVEAFVAAGRGLAAAHAAGMVHRDFKPQNVLRAKAGTIKVGDFGLARDTDEATETAPDRSTAALKLGNVTQTGAFVGTPAYMAPEQWAATTISPATDQFAFCVALWEALVGERPFRGATSEALRASIEAGQAVRDAAKLPPRLRGPILRGLSPDPAHRFATMDALLAALVPRSRAKLVIGGAIALVVAAVIGVAVMWPGPSESPAGPHVWMPKTHRDLLATVDVVGPDRIRVPRATIGQVLLERTELTERMRAIPTTTDDDNRVIGFRLYAIKPDSLAARAGLRNFDQVTALDELPFDTEEHVVAAYRRAQVAPVFAIHYTRGNAPHTLVIEVTR